MEKRDSKGRYMPGSIGNPKGRPKYEPTPQEILREAVPEAVTRLVDLIYSSDDAVALRASIEVLDRVLGKPEAHIGVNFDSAIVLDNFEKKYDREHQYPATMYD